MMGGTAKKLKEMGYTLNVKIDGNTIMRVGKDAKPGIMAIFGPIEITDLRKVISLFGEK